MTNGIASLIIYGVRRNKSSPTEREGNSMINTMMTSTIRNSANGARAKKLKEYINKEMHMNHRIKSNKNRKG